MRPPSRTDGEAITPTGHDVRAAVDRAVVADHELPSAPVGLAGQRGRADREGERPRRGPASPQRPGQGCAGAPPPSHPATRLARPNPTERSRSAPWRGRWIVLRRMGHSGPCAASPDASAPPGHPDDLEAVVTAMTRTLRHRGPDAEGTHVDPSRGLALGNRRLSVSSICRRPATSRWRGPTAATRSRSTARSTTSRRCDPQLDARGHTFRGGSDTEVLWRPSSSGASTAPLERSNGMFAFAVWDQADHALHLAAIASVRSRCTTAGHGRSFLFGSELKALRAHPAFAGEIDRDALALVPLDSAACPRRSPSTTASASCLPGHVLTVRTGNDRPSPAPSGRLRAVADAGAADPFRGTFEEAVEELESCSTTRSRSQDARRRARSARSSRAASTPRPSSH